MSNKLVSKVELNYINNLKATAVLLVILGHSIQYTNSKYDNDFIFKFIYSFHMPLFFFVSGFLLGYTKRENFISKRIKNLLIPFLAWAIFYSFYSNIYNYYVLNIPLNVNLFFIFWIKLIKAPDNGGLWFLWILLLCSFCWYFIERYKKKFLLCILLIIFLNILYIFPVFHLLGLGLLRWYLIFYFIGYYCYEKKIFKINAFRSDKTSKVKIIAYYIFVIIAFITVPFFKRNGLIGNLYTMNSFIQIAVNFFAAVSMSIALSFLYSLYINQKYSILNWIASNSLGFYSVQFIFIGIFSIKIVQNVKNIYAVYLIVTILVFAFTSGTILLISKNKNLNKVFFGKINL